MAFIGWSAPPHPPHVHHRQADHCSKLRHRRRRHGGIRECSGTTVFFPVRKVDTTILPTTEAAYYSHRHRGSKAESSSPQLTFFGGSTANESTNIADSTGHMLQLPIFEFIDRPGLGHSQGWAASVFAVGNRLRQGPNGGSTNEQRVDLARAVCGCVRGWVAPPRGPRQKP